MRRFEQRETQMTYVRHNQNLLRFLLLPFRLLGIRPTDRPQIEQLSHGDLHHEDEKLPKLLPSDERSDRSFCFDDDPKPAPNA